MKVIVTAFIWVFFSCSNDVKPEKIINEKVTEHGLEKLKIGMKISDAVGILGQPCMYHPDVGIEGPARYVPNRKVLSVYTWCYDCMYFQTITVQFEDSVLMKKSFTPPFDIARLNESPCLIQKTAP